MQVKFYTPEYKVPEKVLFSAKSSLIDRFTPAVEKILLPAYSQPRGYVSAKITDDKIVSSSKDCSKLKKLSSKLLKGFKPLHITDRTLVDYRRNGPSNWSHVLNFHIPLALYFSKTFESELAGAPALYLLSTKAPVYIRNIFHIFDLDVFYTDLDVQGRFIDFDLEPFDCLRSIIHRWFRDYVYESKGYKSLLTHPADVPPKIFFSRRGTRRLINEKEIAYYLTEQGYETVYAEDYKVSEQINFFMYASEIVAVHGAAMGPMIFRPSSEPSLRIVEIFSPGLMSNYFRGTAEQIGAKWVGVRGRLEQKHVKDAYIFDRPFQKYSWDDFYVDTTSLESALHYLGNSGS